MSNDVAEPIASQETESLVKRLAGPSTGKAGLAIDQTEINRIIAKASKGSKFYENEKKKDKDLSERIEKILKQRDDAVRDVDLRSIEQAADRFIAELESQRDLSQIIVHVDMDAFFANVELLYNPDLKGKPFGVGRGVLSTASYEARKYGVRSGMPGYIAKKLCPELIFVSSHFSRYMEKSNAVMAILRGYDPNFYAAGCDEAYLNITAYCESHNLTAAECVQEMRKTVFEGTQLTASAGIAPTKMLAKICSDKNKPNGQFELPFEKDAILSFLSDLSIRKVPGVGRVNERLLESIGIKTCGDIFTHRATIYLMEKQFGRQYLFRTYLGITSNVVQPISRDERKSIGAERTFSALSDKEKILQKLNEVAEELEKDMKQNGWTGRTVTLKFKLDTFQVFTRAKTFDRWITKKEELYATGKELLTPEFH
ncbi:putative impB/mucB/samB family protein [Lyophyllum shimeji]|uniref:DNA polymerase kappa n=1 Tax=Lyophyllum shimeji TaxID=47721 RepID=A0A9P3PKN1_LYOSH|nr:putative impB/mucB/samB family protein [Lyophyllum shimeji]